MSDQAERRETFLKNPLCHYNHDIGKTTFSSQNYGIKHQIKRNKNNKYINNGVLCKGTTVSTDTWATPAVR